MSLSMSLAVLALVASLAPDFASAGCYSDEAEPYSRFATKTSYFEVAPKGQEESTIEYEGS